MKSMKDETQKIYAISNKFCVKKVGAEDSQTVIDSSRSRVTDMSALGAMVPAVPTVVGDDLAGHTNRELIEKDRELERELAEEKKQLLCGIENCTKQFLVVCEE